MPLDFWEAAIDSVEMIQEVWAGDSARALAFLTAGADDVLLTLVPSTMKSCFVAVNVRDRGAILPVPPAYQDRSWMDASSGEAVPSDTLRIDPYGYRLLRDGE